MNSALVNRNKDIHIPDSEKLNIDLPKDDLQDMEEIYNEEVLINKSWEPKIGEKYWYVLNANGSKLYDDLEGISIQQTSFTTYDDFETHQDRIFHGNCFKTIEGANNYIRTCGREKLKALLGITSKECMTFQEAKDTLDLTEDMVKSLSDNIATLSYSIHNLFNYSKTNSYVCENLINRTTRLQ